jgi:F420-dependent oxidoreductase-like protein
VGHRDTEERDGLEAVIPTPAVVVLIGPSGSGKSTWAAANFRFGQVLAADDFRAFVGSGSDDQTAGTEAFALLDQLLAARLAKGLTSVIDTTGLDADLRARWRSMAADAGVASVAVGFDTPRAECHRRNATRPNPVPKATLDRQLKAWRSVKADIDTEGFDHVIVDPQPARLVPASMVPASVVPTSVVPVPRVEEAAEPDDGHKPAMEFDLVISAFDFDDIAATVVDMAKAAERAGFRALWLMDHFRQIPQVGRAWDPMLEPYTTLAHLGAHTERLRLGTLVTGVELRNIGLLAKIIATLDVLSNGRAECGLGAGWFDAEQAAYGYPVNTDRVRLDTLADALQALPVLWGPGAKSFKGDVVSIPEAMGYPRPVQDPVPILVGGGGERRTLRLAAQYADACNIIGTDPATVAHKISVLHRHCDDVGRPRDDVLVTTLNPILHAATGRDLADAVEAIRPRNRSAESVAAAVSAATTDEHVARFAHLAKVGVDRCCVALTGSRSGADVEAFGPVIAAFAGPTPQ